MFKTKRVIFAISILVALCGCFNIAHAKKTLGNATNALSTVSQKTGIQEASVPTIVGNVIKTAFALGGIIFFVLMVYAGIKWMTAHGEEENVSSAQKTLISAVIGLVILTGSYAITSFVQTRIIDGQQSLVTEDTGADTAGGKALGCCLDWVGANINDIYGAKPDSLTVGARWTTLSDCKLHGEKNDVGDFHSCAGPKEKCWLFFSSEEGETWASCEQKKVEYN